jgi:hypothetical protein
MRSVRAAWSGGMVRIRVHVVLYIRHEESMWSPQAESPVLGWNVGWGLHIDLA